MKRAVRAWEARSTWTDDELRAALEAVDDANARLIRQLKKQLLDARLALRAASSPGAALPPSACQPP